MFHHINMLCSGHTGEIKDEELFTIDTAGDLNGKLNCCVFLYTILTLYTI